MQRSHSSHFVGLIDFSSSNHSSCPIAQGQSQLISPSRSGKTLAEIGYSCSQSQMTGSTPVFSTVGFAVSFALPRIEQYMSVGFSGASRRESSSASMTPRSVSESFS